MYKEMTFEKQEGRDARDFDERVEKCKRNGKTVN